MLQLIVEQAEQIKKMEDAMGKMIKERQKAIRDAVKGATKEATKATIPLQAVPLIVIPAATTSTGALGESTEQLAKAMENMPLQSIEIKRLWNQVNEFLEKLKGKDSTHATELQIRKKLNESLEKSL